MKADVSKVSVQHHCSSSVQLFSMSQHGLCHAQHCFFRTVSNHYAFCSAPLLLSMNSDQRGIYSLWPLFYILVCMQLSSACPCSASIISAQHDLCLILMQRLFSTPCAVCTPPVQHTLCSVHSPCSEQPLTYEYTVFRFHL